MEVGWFGLQGKMTLVIFLLVSFPSQGFGEPYGIDCGSDRSSQEFGMEWKSDYSYIQTGISAQVRLRTSIRSEQMNTLRFFPNQNKACYELSLFDSDLTHSKYMIRGGFYYGNYDGRSAPPTFDLQINGNFLATVGTLLDQPIFIEVIVMPLRSETSICLARTHEGEIPFISSIEIIDLPLIMYRWMLPTYALYMEYRQHFGGNYTVQLQDDDYKRIWNPANPTGYTKIDANFSNLIESVDDDPPIEVLNTAIEAPSLSDEINLIFNFSGIERPRYITAYFTEVEELQPDQNRTFEIKFGDHFYQQVAPRYQICDEVDTFTDLEYQQDGSLQIALYSTYESTLPPILNALEIFTMMEYQLQETSEQDLEGLKSFAIPGWSGDPCLPVNSTWDWVACNEEDPPRIIALFLAGYGLSGSLGDFSQMIALEIIDLHNNSLDSTIPDFLEELRNLTVLDLHNNSLVGIIPDFLGELPNLRVLNLSYNQLEGAIPESLLNKKIALDVSGNPNLYFPKENKTAERIIGISVFVVVLVLLAVCTVLSAFQRHQIKTIRAQVTVLELHHLQIGAAHPA